MGGDRDDAQDFVALQWVEAGLSLETIAGRGRPREEEPGPAPAIYFGADTPRAERLYLLTTKPVRWIGLSLRLFPLWLIARAILYFVPTVTPWGDYLTVAFVLVVVAFFAALALMLTAHLFVGSREQRLARRNEQFALPGPEQLDRALEMMGLKGLAVTTHEEAHEALSGEPRQSKAIRLEGRVIEVDGRQEAMVLSDQWLETSNGAARVINQRVFGIATDGGPIVIVAAESAPWLLANYDGANDDESPGQTSLALPEHREEAGWLKKHGLTRHQLAAGRQAWLRQGDRVELVAASFEVLPSLRSALVDGRPLRVSEAAMPEGGPYRGSQGPGALLVRSTRDRPLLLRIQGAR